MGGVKLIPPVKRLTAVLAGTVACLCVAADSPLAGFKKLRSDWRTAVMERTKSLRENYARTLKTMETGFVEKGDYASAARARKERLKISGEGPAGEISHGSLPGPVEKGQPVTLDPGGARLTGGVKYNTETGTLTGWAAEGASARWQLPAGMQNAGYFLELTYATAPDAGGALAVKEDFYTLRRDLTATAGWEDFQTKTIGTLRMSADSQSLEFSAGTVKGTELMHLKGLRLLPPDEKQ